MVLYRAAVIGSIMHVMINGVVEMGGVVVLNRHLRFMFVVVGGVVSMVM